MYKLLFTLLILGLFSCAGVVRPHTTGLDVSVQEPLVIIENRDWYPMDDVGHQWGLQDATGEMIGRCYYLYMRFSSVEQWQGVFYQKTSDFTGNPYFSKQTDGLYDCVRWVEQLALGGYSP